MYVCIFYMYVDTCGYRLKLETAFHCSAFLLEADSFSQLQTNMVILVSLLLGSPLSSETETIRKTQCLPVGVRDLNIGPLVWVASTISLALLIVTFVTSFYLIINKLIFYSILLSNFHLTIKTFKRKEIRIYLKTHIQVNWSWQVLKQTISC